MAHDELVGGVAALRMLETTMRREAIERERDDIYKTRPMIPEHFNALPSGLR
jgi:hypothetical protein